ncbi:pseudouridine synthase [Dyadobacter sp. Leaf189]|uniref:pseudouridine synthase n=1 Tax=Dyadobacter sp. Leaf189 TaxID=1736295 RepID=UPI0006FA695B|nr:pseudouridine synthase [Dyadobacter sp. Leaf189]KQS32647.1 pseudouridine synthase [Dyadobacter sp. Leaf189]
MRKRTNNSRPAGGQSSGGGDKSFRKSSGGGGNSFRKPKPETESRFSKPSVKKSSLKFSAQENKPAKSRPSFGHEKPADDRPRFNREQGGFRKDKPFGNAGGFKKDSGFQGEKRSFRKPESGESRPFRPRSTDENSERRPFSDRRTSSDRDERPRFDKTREFRPEGRPAFGKREDRNEFRPRESREGGPRENFRAREDGDRAPRESFGREERAPREGFRPRENRDQSDKRAPRSDRSGRDERAPRGERPVRDERAPREERAPDAEDRSGLDRRVGRYETAPRYNLQDYEKKIAPKKKEEISTDIRLNRYIANAGICSRREADDLISSGQISVNGKTITEMGYKVKMSDVVKYGKKALNPEKMVYILINKPKDYITTTDDPEERKTVLDLIKGACNERVYPVGRLDRNTTGLLLLTNDGELAEKLTHPSSGIKKIYQAELDKPITTEDFERLQHGVDLEDGFIRPDEVGIVTPDAMVVGLEIHSGRNRIVRRMFEQLGYEVQKLDRTVFAGLNKKDLPRGKWRFLSEKEVVKLKYML